MKYKSLNNFFKKLPSKIFITGTDTGVGKTCVSLFIMQSLINRHYRPRYLKPLQTGITDILKDKESDSAFVYRNLSTITSTTVIKQSTLFSFSAAKAPYWAQTNNPIKFATIVNKINKTILTSENNFSHFVIEGAGGVLVPITTKKLMLDLIVAINARPLVVARAGLGTINHTLMTLKILQQKGITPLGVIFVDSTATTPTSSTMIKENISTIERHGKVKVLALLTHVKNFHHTNWLENNLVIF